jgi:hypothetical protein
VKLGGIAITQNTQSKTQKTQSELQKALARTFLQVFN